MKVDLYLIPYTKSNSRWIKDLSRKRAKTTKLLKENKEWNIHDNEFGNGFFLEYATKSTDNKIKKK